MEFQIAGHTASHEFTKWKLMSFAACLVWTSGLQAQEMPFAHKVTQGFRHNARIAWVAPSDQPRQLENRTAELPNSAREYLDTAFSRFQSRALLILQDHDILYEKYAPGTSQRSTPLGFSISKSLTALAVGQAHCQGHIRSLDDPLKNYVPDLADTSWGEATIRQVLTMASGAYRTHLSLNGHKTQALENMIGPNVLEGTMRHNFIDLMKAHDDKELPPGTAFHYNNFDTIALGLLVEGATGQPFAEFFSQRVWQPAGAANRGAWAVTRLGQTSTYQGFSATPHDWLRLGAYVLQALQTASADCLSSFLQAATSPHLSSHGPSHQYGYQIWVNCAPEVDFCFVGYGGQYLLFNQQRRMVIYHHAATFSPVVYGVPQILWQLTPLLSQAKASSVR